MAYNKTVWKDRVVSRPRTYIETSNADGSITHTPSEGTISEAGTPVNATNLNKIETELMEKSTRLDTESLAAVTLAVGKQILNATKNARLQGLKVQGRTLIDLLGGAGSGESLAGWGTFGNTSISTTQLKSGTSSFKFVSTTASYITKDSSTTLDPTKYYIAGCWVFIDSYTSGIIRMTIRDYGTTTSRYGANADTAIIGKWQFVYMKIPTANTVVGTGFRIIAGIESGTAVATAYFDDLRVYAVSAADYAAIGTTITGEAIDRLLPYVPPGINGVDGLWVRRYGKNLLPGTLDSPHANAKMNGPYDYTLVATGATQSSYIEFPVISNTSYTVSMSGNGQYCIANTVGNTTGLLGYGTGARQFNSGTNIVLRLYLSNSSTGAGTFTFKDWQLELGSVATLFQPREDSLIAFGGVELHANPNDGSEPDVLREVNGRYEVTRLWRKMVLDGSLPWAFDVSLTGFKVVKLAKLAATVPMSANNSAMIKYDGKPMSAYTGSASGADGYRQNGGDTSLFITIASADSGWGDSYTPTSDEIKAYFYGYKMYLSGGASTVPYNGTGAKAWAYLTSGSHASTTVPTSLDDGAGGYKPYQLLYRLAAVTTETVQEDGALSLLEGDNFIEVGSGYVSRERVNIAQGVGWYINHKPLPASKLKYLLDRFIGIFKNGSDDTDNWKTNSTGGDATTYAYGNYYAETSGPIDPAASYSVSYLKLDKSPIPGVKGYYAATEKAQLHDLTDAVTEIGTAVSVLAAKKAEKDTPAWITPTLLNGWSVFNTQFPSVRFYKDNQNIVHVQGVIKSGSITMGSIIFILPVGYRPSKILVYGVISSSDDSGVTSLQASAVNIYTDGSVSVQAKIQNGFLSFSEFTFLAEQ